MEFNTQQKTGSAFNPALKYVESIAGLLDILDGCFLREDYFKAHKILIRIYERVEHKLTLEESKKIQRLLDNSLEELKNNQIGIIKKKENFCKKLIEIEKKLKRYMDKYSLLMPSKDDPRFAVLKR